MHQEEAAPLREAALEDWLCVVLLVGILTVMALGVFCRYVLNDSLSWTEEISRYGLVYITYLGCATGIRRQSHIRIDVIERVLPARLKRPLALLVDLLTCAFLATMLVLTFRIIGILWASRSTAVQIPMGWVYGALLAGFALSLVRLGLRHARARR
jgi:TRAP-type C4-dicarboxylate transport system permease small subunit